LGSENGALKEQAKDAHAVLAQMKAELVASNQGKMKAEIELGQVRRELANLKRSLGEAEDRIVRMEEILNEERAER
jgi:predicted  nucleic acid-binding Zn-ribbon protein